MLNHSTTLLVTLALAAMLQASAAPVPQYNEMLEPRWKFGGGSKGGNGGSNGEANHGQAPKNSFGKDLAISGGGALAGSLPMMYMMNQQQGGGSEGQVQARGFRIPSFGQGGGKGGSGGGKPAGGPPAGGPPQQKPSFMREMGFNVGGAAIGAVPMFAMGGGGGGGSSDPAASGQASSSDPAANV